MGRRPSRQRNHRQLCVPRPVLETNGIGHTRSATESVTHQHLRSLATRNAKTNARALARAMRRRPRQHQHPLCVPRGAMMIILGDGPTISARISVMTPLMTPTLATKSAPGSATALVLAMQARRKSVSVRMVYGWRADSPMDGDVRGSGAKVLRYLY